jgi:zinc D-Ala-D-Ala carboxypeptidase
VKLSEHFTLAEFVESETAEDRGIDNGLPPELMLEAHRTCYLLEAIRARLGGVPIILTSGYRCLALNRAIGSDDSSDHLKAMAADFKAPAFGTPFQVAKALEPLVDELAIGQLIHEFGGWVHVSTRRTAKPVNRILTYARGKRPAVGIQEV